MTFSTRYREKKKTKSKSIKFVEPQIRAFCQVEVAEDLLVRHLREFECLKLKNGQELKDVP